MTPVMLAAGKGHTGVVDLLVHKYNCSLTEVNKVSTFVVMDCQSLVGVGSHVSVSIQLSVLNVILHVVSMHLCRMYVTDILPMPSTVE